MLMAPYLARQNHWASTVAMGPCLANDDGAMNRSILLGLVDSDEEEAALLGDKDADGALLGKDDGVTDGSRLLGPADGSPDGDADVSLLGGEDADGALLLGKKD